MHIAILEAGRTTDMPAEFHHYPDMFETLFADQPNSADFRFSIVPVIDDVFPQQWMIMMAIWSLDRPMGFMMMPLYSKINGVYPQYFCRWQTACRVCLVIRLSRMRWGDMRQI